VAKNKGNRPPQRRRPRALRAVEGEPQDLELFQAIRAAVRDDEPLALLGLVSSLMEAARPGESSTVTLTELIESFIGTPFAETTAVLSVMRHLVTDELTSTRINRELAQRRHPMPDWLTHLGDARLEPEVHFLTHILADGDDIFFGVSLPTGHEFSAMVYVDHNLGTVAKDAFVTPVALEEVVERMRTLATDPGQVMELMDPSEARATAEAAIAAGEDMDPPLTTDSWPACRPMIEWMLRLMPAGGTARQLPVWTLEDGDALLEEFLAAPAGMPYRDDSGQALVTALIVFGITQANRIPVYWSNVTVELALMDWFPVQPLDQRQRVPDLLRAFIPWVHEREGLHKTLNEPAMRAIRDFQAMYEQQIQGPWATALRRDIAERNRWDQLSFYVQMVEYVAAKLGGLDGVQSLDTEPLPDEAFVWEGIDPRVHQAVSELLSRIDGCADALLNVEYRTAMRRFLSQLARNDPRVLLRRASFDRGAAAIAWIVCVNNEWRDTERVSSSEQLHAHFGVSGSVGDRANTLVAAFDPTLPYGARELGDSGLLISAQRTGLLNALETAKSMS